AAVHGYGSVSCTRTIGRANLDGTGASQSFITNPPGNRFTPSGVAVDAGHVYWTNSPAGTIGRAKLDGTAVNQNFITGASVPLGVAVGSAHVYWAKSALVPPTRAPISTVGPAHPHRPR